MRHFVRYIRSLMNLIGVRKSGRPVNQEWCILPYDWCPMHPPRDSDQVVLPTVIRRKRYRSLLSLRCRRDQT